MPEQRTISSFIMITVGQTAAYAFSFIRNLILARMLTRADYGLAATFGLAVTMLDLNSKIGLGMQVVQSKDGDSIAFQNTAHSLQILYAAISAGLILLLCVPMAYLFKVPNMIWVFALLSIVPVFRGFGHLDFQRFQREFEFLPSILVELVPQVITTALVWPLMHWIGDFRVILILFLGKELLTMTMTHGLAKRPYRLGWDKMLVHSMWIFGWPLIFNGFLMFAAQQADQILVGGFYSLEILALYSAGASLISAVFQILTQATSGVILPTLSRVQSFSNQFNRRYEIFVQIASIVAVTTIIPLIVAAEQIIVLCYGLKYAGGGIIMAWLSAGLAFRFLRTVPVTGAIARSDTKNLMLTNLFRNCSLILAGLSIMIGFTVEMVAACSMIGEIIALIASAFLFKYHHSVPIAMTIKPSVFMAVWLAIAGVFIRIGVHHWNLLSAVGFSVVLILSYLMIFKRLFPDTFIQILGYRLNSTNH